MCSSERHFRGLLEFRRYIASEVNVIRIKDHHRRTGLEVELCQVHPDHVGCGSQFKVIAPVGKGRQACHHATVARRGRTANARSARSTVVAGVVGSTCPNRSANRKNSRIGKSAIPRKQPLLFSSKQWETSSLGRATRCSVILSQVGVDKVILVRPSLGL
jgi:hypothetical protein